MMGWWVGVRRQYLYQQFFFSRKQSASEQQCSSCLGRFELSYTIFFLRGEYKRSSFNPPHSPLFFSGG